MKLTFLALVLKTRAKAVPGEIVTSGLLMHGASLKLKYIAETCEYKLQVQRNGSAPNQVFEATRFAAWKRELQTFARDFGAGTHARVEYQAGEKTYAAVITWSDDVTVADLAEMEGAVGEFGVSPIQQALPAIELHMRIHEINKEWMERKRSEQ